MGLKAADAKWAPGVAHWLAFIGLCTAGWLCFMHQDVMDTANHGYLLLHALFRGEFLGFYHVVEARPLELAYVHNALYNIVVYLLYALAALPAYLVQAVFGGRFGTAMLPFLGKLVALAGLFGCVVQLRRLARQLGFDEKAAGLAALAFGLSAPVFLSSVVMGQYDVVCLFFMLLAIRALLEGRMWAFALWCGFGLVFKFFSLFILLPLLLLYEKKLHRVALYALASLWLLAPTTLLFLGRTGGQGQFFGRMLEQLLQAKLPGGLNVSAFGLLFALLCVACWLWSPADRPRATIWVCLAAFGLLLLFIQWHPQWVALVCPFVVLAGLWQKRQSLWTGGQLAFYLGFLGVSISAYPMHMDDHLLNHGLPGLLGGVPTQHPAGLPTLGGLAAAIPGFYDICAILFCGALVLFMVLALPVGRVSLADRLFGGGDGRAVGAGWQWALFAAGIGLWAAAVLGFFCLRVLG